VQPGGGPVDQAGGGAQLELAQALEQRLERGNPDPERARHRRQLVARQVLEEVLEQHAEQRVVRLARIELEQQRLDRVAAPDPARLQGLDPGDGAPELPRPAGQAALRGQAQQALVARGQVPVLVQGRDHQAHPGEELRGDVAQRDLLEGALDQARAPRRLALQPLAVALGGRAPGGAQAARGSVRARPLRPGSLVQGQGLVLLEGAEQVGLELPRRELQDLHRLQHARQELHVLALGGAQVLLEAGGHRPASSTRPAGGLRRRRRGKRFPPAV
jgi:hypothetical protein